MNLANTSKESSFPTADEDQLVSDRVEHKLRQRIRTLQAGTMLPPQEELVREFGASRHTIREAMDRLKRDQLILSTRGRGTFVASSKQTKTTVHLVSSTVHHPYNLMCIGVLTDVLRQRGHKVHLVGSRKPSLEWQDITDGHEQAAGAIFIGNIAREELQHIAANAQLPMVHVSDMDERFRHAPVCDTVINDNAAMAFRATEHLIQQGHRRIALVGWGAEKIWDREMRRGYEDAMQAHDLQASPDWILRLPEPVSPDTGLAIEKNARLESHARAEIERWNQQENTPTALVHSTSSELQFRESLPEYFPGMFDPQSIVVMSYWEILQNNYTGASDATAACIRFRDIAERAVDLLKRRRETRTAPTREMQGRIFIAQRRNGQWQEE